MEEVLKIYMINIYKAYQWYYEHRTIITVGNINLAKSIITRGVALCLQ